MRPSRPTSSLSKPVISCHDAESRPAGSGAPWVGAPARAAAVSNRRLSSLDWRFNSRSALPLNFRKSLLAASRLMRVAISPWVAGLARSGSTCSPWTWPAKRLATRNAASIALSALSGCPTGIRIVR